eukprot:NODE_480_length_7860_cov_0.165958.p3 type:complete len:291 gc:universal NODE_480_length_7860_cov_0.165958:1223-351(-)
MTGFIILHLGAGKQKKLTKYKELIKQACHIGEGTVVDDVVNGIEILEDSTIVNCGIGGVNSTSDALLVCKGYGAVTNTRTKNPIRAARFLMELPRIMNNRMTPILISGDDYLKSKGVYEEKENKSVLCEGHDTVGCIGYKNGQLCVGTSSGGILRKDKGRVGSSFVYGVGGFIKIQNNKEIAITSSGAGEQILISDFCRNVVNRLLIGQDYLSILKESIQEFLCDILLAEYPSKLIGILIVVVENAHLEFLYCHSTPTFFFGYKHNNTFKATMSELKTDQKYAIGNLAIS